MKKTTLLLLQLFLLFFCWGGKAQEYVRLGITSGFNADVIANGVGPVSGSTNQRVDGAEYNFLSKDFKLTSTSEAAVTGLPVDRIINATNIPALSFLLQPYNQNNSLQLSAANAPATMVFSNQERASKMYLLATASSATAATVSVKAKINFSDNTSQTITGISVADWLEGTGTNTALADFGRVSHLSNLVENPAGKPKLFSVELTVDEANSGKLIASVELTKTSTVAAVLNVLGVSVIKSPECIVPTAVTIEDVLGTSATIRWVAPTSLPASGFEYEVRISGLPGSGATGLAATGTVANTVLLKNVTGLEGGTRYFVYVRSKCGSAYFSPWTASRNFTTPCVFLPITSTGGTVCGQGKATLTAAVDSGTLKWYDAPAGGTTVGTGPSFQTPLITATTSFWVASVADGSVEGQGGKATSFGVDGTFSTTNWGVVFSLTEEITLKSVDLYSTSAGTVSVAIVNSSGVELFVSPVENIANGGYTTPNVVPLGFTLAAGTGYRMLIKSYSGANLVRDIAAATFPYLDTNNILTVTSSWSGSVSSSTYYYFYNIKYEKGCTSPRQEVVATVTPAPALTLSRTTADVCGGQTTPVITIATGGASYDTYAWSPTTGVSGNAQNGWVFNTTTSQTYTLTASQSTGQRCQITKEFQVNVLPTPDVTYIPATDLEGVCQNTIVPLQITDHNERTVEVGTGVPTSFSNDLSAFNNYRVSAKVQMLFTAQELRDLGLSAGNFNSIAFNVITLGSSASNNNYTVRIAPTSLTAFPSATYITTNFVTVFSIPTYTHTASGWQELVFNTPYAWDGISNLIVEIDHQGINSSASASTLHTVTTDNTVLGGYNSGTPSLSKNRFNTKIKQIIPTVAVWETESGAGLYTDAAATIPYVAETSAKKIYYRPQQAGMNEVTVTVSIANCVQTKVFKIDTITTEQAVADEIQYFCGATKVASLTAQGQRIKWYTMPTGGTQLANTEVLHAGFYYVTQTIDGCESVAKKVEVRFYDQPRVPTYMARSICGAVYINDLDVQADMGNTLKWYDESDNLIANNALLYTGVYYVTQSTVNCESERLRIPIIVNAVPAAPSSSGLIVCGQAKVSDLPVQIAPGATANWYASENSTAAIPSTTLLNSGTYYLSQSLLGCESLRVAVTIAVYAAVPAPVAQNQNFCTTQVRVANLEVTATPGATVNWYSTVTGGTPLSQAQLLTSGLYYVAQKIGECESPRVRVGVNVVNNALAPTAVAQQFCGSATVSQLRANLSANMNAKWYVQEVGGEALSETTLLQNGWYFVSQTIYGCESPRTRVEVRVNAIPQAPTGQAIQEFQVGQVVADLRTDQPGVVWFASLADAKANRGSLLPNIPLSDAAIYYGILFSAEGCYSEPFAVTVKINLGLDGFDLKELNYYPNPVHDFLTITYRETIVKVEVYSLTGQRLLQLQTNDYSVNVDMSALAKASYVVKIYTATKAQSIKVIKK
ncbi:T9SS type A sorting domain-containing protein [Flavobacterium sp. JP2137]|uniref:Ig-like domain-containing protein n=1 Tax=Flavobacterium sp. JP2137 TaxID=3414510 RepID=UPI003D2F9F3A